MLGHQLIEGSPYPGLGSLAICSRDQYFLVSISGLQDAAPSVATEIDREGLCLSQRLQFYALDHLAFTMRLLNLMTGAIVTVLIVINHPLPSVWCFLVNQFGDSWVLVRGWHG